MKPLLKFAQTKKKRRKSYHGLVPMTQKNYDTKIFEATEIDLTNKTLKEWVDGS